MKTIWKFELAIADRQVVEMPSGATILSVAVQHGKACLWATVTPENTKDARTIRIYGTGESVPNDPGRHIGTFMVLDGNLVFHAFECRG